VISPVVIVGVDYESVAVDKDMIIEIPDPQTVNRQTVAKLNIWPLMEIEVVATNNNWVVGCTI